MFGRIFIVHGRDSESLIALRNIIRLFGLEVVVLSDSQNLSFTIIEKFERFARACDFSFVLLTPDDEVLGSGESEAMKRARQNVIFEMGWFFGKLGRSRTCLVHKIGVEIPSDIGGVERVSFEERVDEKTEAIKRVLMDFGVLD